MARACRRGIRSWIPWLMVPPPVGAAGFRRWRSIRPIRRNFGWDSGGQCVDRHYIERFLDANRGDVRGRVLEIGDNHYTLKYGANKVTKSEVLHAVEGNPMATIVGDLTTGDGLPDDAFDCIILTQTLSFVPDPGAVVRTVGRILAPDGVALVTTGGISQTSRYDMDRWGDFWRLTSRSVEKLFHAAFPPENVDIEAHGNIASAIALLHGIVASELTADELESRDPDYEVIITARAVKPAGE